MLLTLKQSPQNRTLRVTRYRDEDTSHKKYMILALASNTGRMHTPNEAMIVGTSLTEMKSETLSMIPSKAHPKLRMSAGSNSPEQIIIDFILIPTLHNFSCYVGSPN